MDKPAPMFKFGSDSTTDTSSFRFSAPAPFDFDLKTALSPKQEEAGWTAAKETVALVSSVRRALECPVCLDMVSVPVRMCNRGHVICSSCTHQLTTCSVCRQPLLEGQPTCLKSLLEVLPRQCRYSDDGCKVTFIPGEDSHEEFCRFRPIQCKASNCGEGVKLCEMREHYENKHPKSCVLKQQWTPHSLSLPSFLSTSESIDHTPVLDLNDHFFYFKAHNDTLEKVLKFSFEAYLTESPKFDYYINVTFKNAHQKYSWSIKATVMKESMPAENTDGQFYMKLPQSVLCNFALLTFSHIKN